MSDKKNETPRRLTLKRGRETEAAASAPRLEERLHKVLAQAGLGSRRALEQRIADGLVKVNGEVATVGMSVAGGLYVIIDPESCRGRSPVEVARHALDGGASMLQWRDKLREKGLQLDDVAAVLRLCIAQDATLIVNDHADLALVLAARGHRVPGAGTAGRPPAGLVGVHVGQKDLPVADVRRNIGQQVTLIGRRLVPMRPDVVMRVADGKVRLERGLRGDLQPGRPADGHA